MGQELHSSSVTGSLSSRLALPEAAAEELRRLAPGRTGSTRDVF